MTTQSNGNNLTVQGRLMWITGNSVSEGKQKTDYNTNAPVFAQNGDPVKEYGFGLAIPKVDARTGAAAEEFTKIWNALHKEAFTLYPSGQIPPGFAMKFKDGDGIDHNGKPFADREGHAGHIILSCTTQIPIKCFVFQGGNNILVNEGIKCGDYVNVQLNIKAHPAKGQGKPGLYLNPSALQLIQEGKEIVNTPSGDQIFGAAAPVGYAGEVVAHVPSAMPNVAPGQAVAAPVVADPNYGVLPTVHQPATPVPVPVMPAAAVPMGQTMGNVVPVTPAALAPIPSTPMTTPGSAPTAYLSSPAMPVAPLPPGQ